MTHLYGLVDELNDTEAQMIGMKPKDAIKLNQVPLVNRENYSPDELRMGFTAICYNLVKNMMINVKEQQIGYEDMVQKDSQNERNCGRLW